MDGLRVAGGPLLAGVPRNGKEEITVHQLLTHQAGLPFLDRPVSLDDLNDPDRLGSHLAPQKPQ
jgi:CubicO group peptidase (beta-lactamase class C family)